MKPLLLLLIVGLAFDRPAHAQWIGSLAGHKAGVLKLAISPDAKVVASASRDGTVKLWELATGNVIATLTTDSVQKGAKAGRHRPSSVITAVAFAPDGKTVASGGSDRKLQLWDVATGKLVHQSTPHRDWITDVGYSPDGKYLATASWDGVVYLWTRDPHYVATFPARAGWIHCLALAPDSKTLAFGCSDGNVEVWDINERLRLKVIASACGSVESLQFSPDGKRLAIGGWNKRVAIVETESLGLVGHLKDIAGPVKFVKFSPQGDRLAVGGWHCQVSLFEVPSLRHVHSFVEHDWFSSCLFLDQGHALAAGAWNGNIRIWTLRGDWLRQVSLYAQSVGDLAIGQSGDIVTFTTEGRYVWIWNTHSDEPTLVHSTPEETPVKVASSIDGKWLASADAAKALLWNTAEPMRPRKLEGHRQKVRDLAFSPDSRYLVTVSDDRRILIWDAETGQQQRELRDSLGAIHLVRYRTTRPELVTVGENLLLANEELKLWDIKSGKAIASYDLPEGNTLNLALAPDGKTLATTGDPGHIQLWDMALRQPTHRLAGAAAAAATPRLLANGKVAAISESGRLLAWTAADGERCELEFGLPHERVLLGGYRLLRDLACSSDGRWLATAGNDHARGRIVIRVIPATAR